MCQAISPRGEAVAASQPENQTRSPIKNQTFPSQILLLIPSMSMEFLSPKCPPPNPPSTIIRTLRLIGLRLSLNIIYNVRKPLVTVESRRPSWMKPGLLKKNWPRGWKCWALLGVLHMTHSDTACWVIHLPPQYSPHFCWRCPSHAVIVQHAIITSHPTISFVNSAWLLRLTT